MSEHVFPAFKPQIDRIEWNSGFEIGTKSGKFSDLPDIKCVKSERITTEMYEIIFFCL